MAKFTNVYSYPLEQLLGPNRTFILVSSKPWMNYKDGNLTDEQKGTTYYVVDSKTYERYGVQVSGDIDTAISNEEIEASKEPVIVTFKNAVGTFYADNNRRVQLSIKADAIDVL